MSRDSLVRSDETLQISQPTLMQSLSAIHYYCVDPEGISDPVRGLLGGLSRGD